MKKILDFMAEGKYVFVDDFAGWAQNDLQGFKPINIDVESLGLEAEDGSIYEKQCATLRRGTHLEVRLKNGEDSERVKLGDFFPNQEVVIQTTSEVLCAFAPICNTQMELLSFLGELANHKEMRNNLRENCQELALWLYKHNVNKAKEPLLGI